MNKSPLNLNLKDLAKNKTLVIVLIVVALFLVIICLTLWLPYLGGLIAPGDGNTVMQNDGNTEEADLWQPSTCEELLGKAMDASYDGCEMIGSNQICYGNFDVTAQLVAESVAQFVSLGDTIPINQLVTLNTAPMDVYHDIWGIAVFKLQANMPGTIPGQNVTFLVFGDTGLYNFSGDMYSIYFSTGIGSVTCSQVPDGLMIDVPDGSGVVFNANGVELALEGDSVLAADPGENMSVTMLNGTGTVTSEGQSQDISAGEMVTIPLGDDLQAEGAPSNPISLPPDVALELCLLTGGDCDEEDPLAWIPTNTPDPDSLLTDTPEPGETGTPTATIGNGASPTNTTAPGAPTATSPPPDPATDTPIPATCDNIFLGGYTLGGNTVSLNITNNNSSEVVISRIQLSWNEGTNGLLDEIDTTKTLWGQGGDSSSSPADISFLADRPHRTIDPAGLRTVSFIFENEGAVQPSSLIVHFDIGCSKSK
jgi:hypothetical protein